MSGELISDGCGYRKHVVGLACPIFGGVVDAPALSYTSKIKFDSNEIQLKQNFKKRIDHFIVHGPAVERMRMRNNRETTGVTETRLG